MTVGFAAMTAPGTVMLADSRVTWRAEHSDKELSDILRKIYRVTPWAAICFAGDVRAAAVCLSGIGSCLDENDDVRVIGQNLKNWFTSRYAQSRSKGPLEFLVAGNSRGQFIIKLLSYSLPSFEPTFHLTKPAFQIIGSGAEIQSNFDVVFRQIVRTKGGLKLHGLQLLHFIRDMTRQANIDTVGGLFQVAYIDSAGLFFDAYDGWIRGESEPGIPTLDADFSLLVKDGRYVQRNNLTGAERPLRDVWEPLPREGEFNEYRTPYRPREHRAELISQEVEEPQFPWPQGIPKLKLVSLEPDFPEIILFLQQRDDGWRFSSWKAAIGHEQPREPSKPERSRVFDSPEEAAESFRQLLRGRQLPSYRDKKRG